MWTQKQKMMLRAALRDPKAKVAYWCSDQFGGPANHQLDNYGAAWRAYPGRVDKLKRKTPEPCSPHALHATLSPHRWRGVRVWVVALRNWVDDGDKLAATERTIIGEVTPEMCIDPAVGARIGMRADLQHTILQDADLRHADLQHADLRHAILQHANLWQANLRHADLRHANLRHANLFGGSFIAPDGSTITQIADLAKWGAIV